MTPLKVFIVDDDKDVAEGLADVLEMSGHEVTLAHSGADAIEIFSKQDFDVAFMDVMMPGMNGVESFMEIRKVKPDARIYMMTGYSVEQLLQQAVENGAVGVLHKPVAVDLISQALEDIQQDKRMVLVADDDPDFTEGMKQALESQGYATCVAHDGQEALDRVLAGNVDVLVLDIRMPVIDGLEVYLALKEQGKTVPTIVVTGHAEEQGRAADILRDMDITGILVKPFDTLRLLEALEGFQSAA